MEYIFHDGDDFSEDEQKIEQSADNIEDAVFHTSNPDIFFVKTYGKEFQKQKDIEMYRKVLNEEIELEDTSLEPEMLEYQILDRLRWYSEQVNDIDTGPIFNRNDGRNRVEQLTDYILEEANNLENTIVIGKEPLDIKPVLKYEEKHGEKDFNLNVLASAE